MTTKTFTLLALMKWKINLRFLHSVNVGRTLVHYFMSIGKSKFFPKCVVNEYWLSNELVN